MGSPFKLARGSKCDGQGGELIRGNASAFVKAHLFVGGAVLGGPMARAGSVARLATFIFKGEEAGEKWIGRRQPGAGVGVCECDALVPDELQGHAVAGHPGAVGALHGDQAGAAGAYHVYAVKDGKIIPVPNSGGVSPDLFDVEAVYASSWLGWSGTRTTRWW